MGTINIQNYYVRDDQIEKGYKQVRAIAGRKIQSAETNDIQLIFHNEIKSLGDTLFGGATIVRGGALVKSGEEYIEGDYTYQNYLVDTCLFYFDGYFIDVPAISGDANNKFRIRTNPADDTVSLGIWVDYRSVGGNEDTTLKDPAIGTAAYQQLGADRLKVTAQWGRSDATDIPGDFKAIYEFTDSELPQVEVTSTTVKEINQAIAHYDFTTSGSYVIDGMIISNTEENVWEGTEEAPNGGSYLQVSEGSARVNGQEIVFNSVGKILAPWVENNEVSDIQTDYFGNGARLISEDAENYYMYTEDKPLVLSTTSPVRLHASNYPTNSLGEGLVRVSKITHTGDSTAMGFSYGAGTFIKIIEGTLNDAFNGIIDCIIPTNYDPTNDEIKFQISYDIHHWTRPSPIANEGTLRPTKPFITLKLSESQAHDYLTPSDVEGTYIFFANDSGATLPEWLANIPSGQEFYAKYLGVKNTNLVMTQEARISGTIIAPKSAYKRLDNLFLYSDVLHPDEGDIIVGDDRWSVDYQVYLNRIDILVLDSLGALHIVKGKASETYSLMPSVVDGLKLGNIYNSWGVPPRVESDYYKTLKVSELQDMKNLVLDLRKSMGDLQLSLDMLTKPGTKNTYFTETFLTDNNLDFSDSLLSEGEYFADLDTSVGVVTPYIEWETAERKIPYSSFIGRLTSTSAEGDTYERNRNPNNIINLAQTGSTRINPYSVQGDRSISFNLGAKSYSWVAEDIPKSTYTTVKSSSLNKGVVTGYSVFSSTTETVVSNGTFKVPGHTIAISNLKKLNGDATPVAYIDNILVPSSFTHQGSGVFTGTITIPDNLIKSGTHLITIEYVVGGVTFVGETTYDCIPLARITTTNYRRTEGTRQTIWRRIKKWFDPIAETVRPNVDCLVESIDLYFSEAPNDGMGMDWVDVCVFQTTAGFPDADKIIATSRKYTSEIVVNHTITEQNPTRFYFDIPFKLDANVTYAIVVMSESLNASVRTAKVGDWDEKAQQFVLTQPYGGVFLQSTNSETWTPVQEKDLTFRMNFYKFIGGTQTDTSISEETYLLNETASRLTGYTDVFLGLSDYVPLGTSVNYNLRTSQDSSIGLVDFPVEPQRAYTVIPKEGNTGTLVSHGALTISAIMKSTVLATDANNNTYTSLSPIISKDIWITYGTVKFPSVVVSKPITVDSTSSTITFTLETPKDLSNPTQYFEVRVARRKSDGTYDFEDFNDSLTLTVGVPVTKNDVVVIPFTKTSENWFTSGSNFRYKIKLKRGINLGIRPQVSNVSLYLS